jgi:hypothetical protein
VYSFERSLRAPRPQTVQPNDIEGQKTWRHNRPSHNGGGEHAREVCLQRPTVDARRAMPNAGRNHDGIGDVIWDNGHGVEGGWLMNANGQIGGTLQLPFFPSWTVLGTGDFNYDGNTDVLCP